ncbi:hypothetical protein OIU76_017397 [Salix suchowensis]|nr:hypothetical protein OIU76_017397 [Salix suchowensis]
MARKMLIDGEVNHTNQVEEVAHFDFDLFVIGAGSGGVRAARFSANYGAKVGICELPFHPISSEVIGGVGGTCVIRGCVPKKILVYGANFGGEIEDAKNYGWELNEKVDYNWKKLLQKKESLSFISFLGLPFSLEGVKRGQVGIVSFQLHPCLLEKGKKMK